MAVRGHRSAHVHTSLSTSMDPKERARLVNDALRVRAMVRDAFESEHDGYLKVMKYAALDPFLSAWLIAHINPQ